MNVGDVVLAAQVDEQDAPPRAATRTLQEHFTIRHVMLQLEGAYCPSDGHC